jgi:hypothetical protein
MWGPQSAAPDSKSPPSRRRRFTLAQANRALPLVERIVTDIVRTHAEAVGLQSRVARVPPADQPAARRDLDRHLERLEDYVDELTEVGVDLKDYTVGLVDFTGRHQGRDVCLCWRLGEATVGHWHEQDAGFGGRQPAATLREGE